MKTPTPVTAVTDASPLSGDTPLVNMDRRTGTKVLLEPEDTKRGWKGEAASVSLIKGSPVAACYDLQRRLLVPPSSLVFKRKRLRGEEFLRGRFFLAVLPWPARPKGKNFS